MHEMAIVSELIDVCAERANGARVHRVVLTIGKLSCVLPDAVRFCFDLAAEGTALQGATLEIREKNGLARCRRCSASFTLDKPFGRCECGGTDLEWLEGEELGISAMEVSDVR
jgi:hydrogenase nickel incorporation protein HypA/HybF